MSRTCVFEAPAEQTNTIQQTSERDLKAAPAAFFGEIAPLGGSSPPIEPRQQIHAPKTCGATSPRPSPDKPTQQLEDEWRLFSPKQTALRLSAQRQDSGMVWHESVGHLPLYDPLPLRSLPRVPPFSHVALNKKDP